MLTGFRSEAGRNINVGPCGVLALAHGVISGIGDNVCVGFSSRGVGGVDHFASIPVVQTQSFAKIIIGQKESAAFNAEGHILCSVFNVTTNIGVSVEFCQRSSQISDGRTAGMGSDTCKEKQDENCNGYERNEMLLFHSGIPPVMIIILQENRDCKGEGKDDTALDGGNYPVG